MTRYISAFNYWGGGDEGQKSKQAPLMDDSEIRIQKHRSIMSRLINLGCNGGPLKFPGVFLKPVISNPTSQILS